MKRLIAKILHIVAHVAAIVEHPVSPAYWLMLLGDILDPPAVKKYMGVDHG